jgi:glucosamine-6-phosphate deaminase
VVVVEGPAALARSGADRVAAVLETTPAASIVVATGNSPIGVYAALAERRRAGALDTSRQTAFQLDEYLGLEPGDRRSLFGWMDRTFLEPLGIDPARVVTLPTDGDVDGACAAFDRALEARGGLDLAVLGLGGNGHLGFNEPPSEAAAGSRVVTLRPETLEANASYWDDADVPRRAVTIGMRPLLAARQILLVVSGVSKHAIVHAAVEGPVGPDVPASFLQVATGTVVVLADRAAWEGAP